MKVTAFSDRAFAKDLERLFALGLIAIEEADDDCGVRIRPTVDEHTAALVDDLIETALNHGDVVSVSVDIEDSEPV